VIRAGLPQDAILLESSPISASAIGVEPLISAT
jgi:hypothetical protein